LNHIGVKMRLLYYSELINSASGAGVHGRMFFKTAKQMGVKIRSYPMIKHPAMLRSKKLRYIESSMPPGILELLLWLRGRLQSYRNARRLILLHRDYPFDLILMRLQRFDWSCWLVAKELDIPLVLEVNSPISLELGYLRGRSRLDLYSRFESEMWNQADHIMVVSEALSDYLISKGVQKTKISVNPNGVDPEVFKPSGENKRVRSRLGLGNQPIITFSGSLMPWHDVDVLIRALPHLRSEDAVLLLIGTSSYAPKIDRLCSRLNITERVLAIGQVHYGLMPEYLGASDILAATYLPTRMFYFSPLKIMEYMAMAKPIIASSLGDNSVLLKDGCGLLVKPGRVNDVISAIDTLISNPRLSQEMGRRARERVISNYTWRHNVNRVLGICDLLLSGYLSSTSA